jgi:uncharacterized integral membrane protein
MTIKRIIALIILVPVAIVLVAFIVANRTSVRLALDPFNPDESAFSFTAPFFVWLFGFLAIGILVGGITTWLTQHKYRKAARERQAELNACRMKLRQEQKELHIS